MSATIAKEAIRAQFPSLERIKDTILADAAGGSQICSSSLSVLTDYLLECNVQNADYTLSRDDAMARIQAGYASTALLMGKGVSPSDVGFAASATQAVDSLARMIEESVKLARKEGAKEGQEVWDEGDEIILTSADHETNRGAWLRLASALNLKVKTWDPTPISSSASNPFSVTLQTHALSELVTPRTRLLAFTACSNLLGTYTDVKAACDVAKERSGGKCWTVVDCVALAPHKRVTPIVWGCDFAFFSWYKVYAPHIGTMYYTPRSKAFLSKLNHHFTHGYPGLYPYQPSSQQYELIASVTGVVQYFLWLGRGAQGKPLDKPTKWEEVFGGRTTTLDMHVKSQADEGLRAELDESLERAFKLISDIETQDLIKPVMALLTSDEARKIGVRVLGSEEDDSKVRGPTIAFVKVDAEGKEVGMRSKAIFEKLTEGGKIGAQSGHGYAYALIELLGLAPSDGIVRVSFVHYNERAEVDAVVAGLRRAFDEVK